MRRTPALLVVALLSVSSSAESVHAQATPSQPYFEWARPVYSPEEFADRRARMTAELSDGALLFVPSADGRAYSSSFRQDDNFHYFTGLELPRSVLVIRGGDEPLLFVPAEDFRFGSDSRPNDFPGRNILGDPAIAAWSGLSIHPATRLESSLIEWQQEGRTLLVAGPAAAIQPPTPNPFVTPVDPARQFAEYLRATVPGVDVGSAYPALQRVRGIKTRAEVERMAEVAQLTARAIAHAASFVREGVTERALEAEFEAECKRGGGQRIPFHPIVKSGPNSLWPWRILAAHYDRRNRPMEDGELVIFDVGCELDHQVSDVGRTFPVSGRFTPRQREILEMEVAVADQVIAAIRPGITFAELRAVADAAIPAEHKPFMQAALFFGHHIGLSTGDPIDETAPLEPGMVFTVEPWYYNHIEQISVFTEDVVTVTETGVEVLSGSLPRTPDELEAMVGGAS